MAAQIGLVTQQATIASGQSLSGEIDLGAAALSAVYVPAAWTAANITIQGSPDGGATWFDVWTDAGAELTLVAAPGHALAVDPTRLRGFNCLKLRSGTGATPVAQGSTVQLIVVAKL